MILLRIGLRCNHFARLWGILVLYGRGRDVNFDEAVIMVINVSDFQIL